MVKPVELQKPKRRRRGQPKLGRHRFSGEQRLGVNVGAGQLSPVATGASVRAPAGTLTTNIPVAHAHPTQRVPWQVTLSQNRGGNGARSIWAAACGATSAVGRAEHMVQLECACVSTCISAVPSLVRVQSTPWSESVFPGRSSLLLCTHGV